MRVMCINNKPIPESSNKGIELLEEGEIYTVSHTIKGHYISGKQGIGYRLKEVKSDYLYSADRFIPLTGEDTEIILEEEVLCESLLSEG